MQLLSMAAWIIGSHGQTAFLETRLCGKPHLNVGVKRPDHDRLHAHRHTYASAGGECQAPELGMHPQACLPAIQAWPVTDADRNAFMTICVTHILQIEDLKRVWEVILQELIAGSSVCTNGLGQSCTSEHAVIFTMQCVRLNVLTVQNSLAGCLFLSCASS